MPNWLIIPTYNEALNIKELVAHINQNGEWQILVVDDNSPDGTAGLVEQLQVQHANLHLIRRPAKLGLGSAYRIGFKFALERGAAVVGEMDADLSHQPEDLPRLLQPIENGADVVIGSRRAPGGRVIGWAWHRRLMSFAAMTLARLILGLKTKDVTSGFRLYTKQALEKIPWQQVKSEGYAWQEEILYLCEQASLRITEVPVVFIDRKRGQSKLKIKDATEFFKTIGRLKMFKK